MSKPLTAILIGAGQRGADSYAPYAFAHPEEIKFIAVAEPDSTRREKFRQQHHIAGELCFETWEDALERPQLADVALVCTQDWMHTQPAVKAMRAGYHVLLEKPMANHVDECRLLLEVSRETQRQLVICHVLRYTEHFRKMREIIQSGVLGEIVQVAHRENVSYWHMAHSYVRGNWRNQEETSPMILAKCCHDLDILPWMLEQECTSLVSMGDLNHFKSQNAPDGAPLRCLDGCPAAETCPYYAPNIYLTLNPLWSNIGDLAKGFERFAAQTYTHNPALIKALSWVVPPLRQMTAYRGFPVSVLHHDPTPENLLQALQDGPYGRCVYHCDNTVVDHQVVSMRMSGGALVTLTMHGFSHNEHRSTRIEGSHGRLFADFGLGGSHITLDEHRTDWHEEFNTSAALSDGHGGGDFLLMEHFVKRINSGDFEQTFQDTKEALTSHLLAFAAEESRLQEKFIHQQAWTV